MASFTCLLCVCDMKNVAVLRDHCRGNMHTGKALQKAKEYRDSLK